MRDTYSLPARKARICRIAGAAFLVLAVLNLVGAALWLIAPAPHIYCGDTGCRWASEPLTLLDEGDRHIAQSSPEHGHRFASHVARPPVRLALAAIDLVQTLPFSFLIFGIGVALRRLGGRSYDPLSRALPWLRRASIAAIVWAVARALSASLLATALGQGLSDDELTYYFAADWGEIGTALMLSIAAYATMWALEAGVRAQRDLAEIV